jgi:hypothetical protein
MYIEWWMWLVLLLWYIVSIISITKSARKHAWQDGCDAGCESTLKVLEDNQIIIMKGEEILPFINKKMLREEV